MGGRDASALALVLALVAGLDHPPTMHVDQHARLAQEGCGHGPADLDDDQVVGAPQLTVASLEHHRVQLDGLDLGPEQQLEPAGLDERLEPGARLGGYP